MRDFIRLTTAIAIACTSAGAVAGGLSKEQCIEAHAKAQDAREQNKLSLARKMFLTCAQSSCPGMVQEECARLADELTRQQPTISFAARDASGADLPDTSVYVDDMLVVTRLDDGKPHDVDPGRHIIKFSYQGKEQIETIVVETGEKGRLVVGNFKSIGTPSATAAASGGGVTKSSGPKVHHPIGSRALQIGGGAVLVAGITMVAIGVHNVPSNCSLSSAQCVASPNDPSLNNASKAAKLVDFGIATSTVGLAAVVGGFVWYYVGAKPDKETMVVAPWVAPTGGGLALSGRL
jgi:hypothetical protein